MDIIIKCDRCGKQIKGTKTPDFTGGYYDLRGSGNWRNLADAKEDEEVICDACMFASPKYIAVYGKQA